MSKKVKRAQTADPSSLEGLDGVFKEPAVTATPDASSSADVLRLRNELMNGLFKSDDPTTAEVAKGPDYFSPSAPPKRHRDGRVDFEPYNTGYDRPGNPFNKGSYEILGSEADLANVGVGANEASGECLEDSGNLVPDSGSHGHNDSFVPDSSSQNDSGNAYESAGYYENAGYNGENNYDESFGYDGSQGDSYDQAFEAVQGNSYAASTGQDSFDEPAGHQTQEATNTATTVHARPLLDEVAGSFIDSVDRVSKNDVIHILEGFVSILRTDEVSTAGSIPLTSRTAGRGSSSADSGNTRAQIVTAPDEQEQYTEAASVVDKTAELEDMRRLVVEAQETIIKLLTDRVEDRARIATLETELRLLPDLQEQADRAMAVAFKTEDFRAELHKVKYELQAYRAVNSRRQVPRGPRAWLNTVRRWFLKAQGLSMREIYELRQRVADNQEQP